MSWAQIPQVSVRWLVVTERKQEVLVVSEPRHWVSHWDPAKKRSIRCSGADCYGCAIGAGKQLRVVVMVVDKMGDQRLFELRERHREVFDRFQSLVGIRIAVRKEGLAKNSPVTVRVLGQEAAVEHDITRLVDALGLDPVRLVAERPKTLEERAGRLPAAGELDYDGREE